MDMIWRGEVWRGEVSTEIHLEWAKSIISRSVTQVVVKLSDNATDKYVKGVQVVSLHKVWKDRSRERHKKG